MNLDSFFWILLLWPSYMVGKFLLRGKRGNEEPKKAVREVFVIMLLSIVVVGFLNEIVLNRVLKTTLFTYATPLTFNTLSILFFPALIEELFKFVPLALHLINKQYFDKISDGVIYFTISGLAFGIYENISYALIGGTETLLVRVFTLMFLHAGTTAMVGYAFALYRFRKCSSWFVAFSFMFAVLLHTFYNFFITSETLWFFVGLLLSTISSCLIFILNYKSRRKDLALKKVAVF